MKNMYFPALRTIYYTLLLIMIACLYGCGGAVDSAGTKILASTAVQPSNNKLAVGKTQQFTLVDTYTDGTVAPITSSPVSWSSSSSSVVTIDSNNGMAAALAPGQTTIKAMFGGYSCSTRLTVPATTLVSLAITSPNQVIAVNTVQQYTVTGAYSDGTFHVLTSGVFWSSSDTSTATIDPNGRITALAAGTATITAVSSGVTATAPLTVTAASLDSIALTPSNPTVAAGTILAFSAMGTYSDSTTSDLTNQVTWSSSAPAIAAIDQDGRVTAIAVGSTTITAAASDGVVPASTTLTVSAAVLETIAIIPSNSAIVAGTTRQFGVTGMFSDGSTQDLTTQVTWSSSTPAIAAIDQNGLATAATAGTVTITATAPGVSPATTTLIVTDAAVAGTWVGTYTIYDSADPAEIGTYTFKFVLNQNGAIVTGSSALRYDIPDRKSDGLIIEAHVTGDTMEFAFKYIDPRTSHAMVNIGSASIAGAAMTGNVLENYNGGYNCSYVFDLKKL